MPIYEYACPNCGYGEDIFPRSAEWILKCPTCGADAKKLVSGIRIVGVTDSKTFRIPGTRKEITTMRELRAYERKHQNSVHLAPGTVAHKNVVEESREFMHSFARKQGFRSVDEMKRVKRARRAERAKGKVA